MAIILGKIKCLFCGQKGGNINSVHQYGIYGEIGKRHFYHPECLESVDREPEFYGHLMADKAIFIHDLQERGHTNYNSSVVKKHKEQIEKCHANAFQRMLPRK